MTSSPPEVARHERLYIGGKFVVPAGDEHLQVFSPASEALIGVVPRATSVDVDNAVAAARAAFDDGPWPKMPLVERARVVSRLADEIERRVGELVPLIVSEVGAPVSGSGTSQVERVPDLLRSMVTMAGEFPYEEERATAAGRTLVVHEPVGVAGIIVPWNGPLFVTILKLGPALLAGCTAVIKPAEETPLDSYVLAECLTAAGVPEGVVSIVPGTAETGEALVRHRGIDKIGFTGSTETGKRIAALCASSLTRYTLELGGKSAALFLDDGDVDTLVHAVVSSAFGTNGQQCYGLTRVVVTRRRYEDVVEQLAHAVDGLVIGDPTERSTEIGPLISERQRDRVEAYIADGLAEGARLRLGGGRPNHVTTGWYVEPTVFTDVDNKMRIAQEEIFGPVLSVIPCRDVTEGIQLVNDSKYGLSGAVFTADEDRGVAIARGIRTGTFTVNGFSMKFETPFGGFKESGIGREYGPEGLASYTEVKSIHLS